MKKLAILIILCLFGKMLFAQNSTNFSIGPKFGLTLSETNATNADIIPGIQYGITSTYSINQSSGVGVDVLLSQNGYKVNNNVYRLNYIKIPLLYKFFFNELGDAFRPRIEVGLSPAFLLNASNEETNISNAYNKTALGVMGGLGFNYRLSNRVWLNADLRADYGLTDITVNNSNPKNRVIGINLGVAYGL